MWHSSESNKILHKKIKFKLTNFIYPNLLTTLPLLIIAGLILFVKLKDHLNINKTYLLLWLLVLLTSVISQAALAIWFQKTKYTLKWEHLYHKFLVINAGLIGLLWGIAGVMFMPEDSVGQSYILFTLAFIAAGGLLYLTGSYLAGSIYVTGVLFPIAGLCYYFFSSQNNHEIYFNVMLSIMSYWAFLLAINYFGSKLYAENFTQRLIIKNVTEDLFRANEEIEKINLIPLIEKQQLSLLQIHETPIQKKPGPYSDALTGLDTQEILEIKFIQARAYARRHHQGFAILYLEISNFNDIKIKLGDEIANQLLKTVSIRLKYCKRETDILTRSNENKFILILSEVLFGNEIRAVTNRISKTFDENIEINGNKIQVNVSIGISLYPLDGENLDELIKKSEIALSYLNAENESSQFHFQIYDRKKMSISIK